MTMFLGSYRFAGDPAALLPAYDKLVAAYPDAVDLHACVIADDGITVYDACPSREVFEGFTAGPEFAAAVADAGLPRPVVTGLGDVHRARLREAVG
jgi:hypothetical protein